jgi:hypothetical protein
MELGSAQHKQILIQSILKTALRTAGAGLLVGLVLMVPVFFRENAFSTGLAYAGYAIIGASLIWALWLAYSKYQRLIKPFNDTFN